jgi:hypothetical protein
MKLLLFLLKLSPRMTPLFTALLRMLRRLSSRSLVQLRKQSDRLLVFDIRDDVTLATLFHGKSLRVAFHN